MQEPPKTTTKRPLKPYRAEDIDLEHLSSLAETKLGVKPFEFQLEIAAAILRGEDVIADIGTGGGKTLSFILPILLNEQDITIVVSPLSALMIDQVSSISDPHHCKMLMNA
jgi:superfamily II DNA helicase RecQ